MHATPRPLEIAGLWPFLAVLLAVAFVAFWPTYFAPGLGSSAGYVHLHAVTASIWVVMLIVQPWLIRTHRYQLHRRVGKASFFVAPLVVLSMLLLANYRLRTIAPEAYRIQTYVLYLQFSLGGLFALSFVLAMLNRRNTEVHARFMVCTALTLVDPVFARLFYWIHPESFIVHQWLTYGLTDLLFVVLIVFERNNLRARWVFPAMLATFVAFQVPALLWLTEWPIWQAVVAWFASLPLT